MNVIARKKSVHFPMRCGNERSKKKEDKFAHYCLEGNQAVHASVTCNDKSWIRKKKKKIHKKHHNNFWAEGEHSPLSIHFHLLPLWINIIAWQRFTCWTLNTEHWTHCMLGSQFIFNVHWSLSTLATTKLTKKGRRIEKIVYDFKMQKEFAFPDKCRKSFRMFTILNAKLDSDHIESRWEFES